MLKHILFAAAAIGALAAPVHAQTEMAVDADRLVETVRTLASDTFEGRAPGTRGEERTLGYLIARLEALGLEPAGPDGQWLQKVPLLHTRLKAPRTLDFATPKGKVSPRLAEDIYLSTIRPEDAARVANAPLVFVGYGVKAPERGWDDFKGADLKGKVAVFLINDPDFVAKPGEPAAGKFGDRTMTYYGRWTYKYEEAARQGAAAALIVHDTVPAAYGWSVVESSWTGPQFFAQSADKGASETQANGWIQKEAAEKLLASAGQDLTALSAAAKRKGFKPVPLGLKASVSFANAIETTISNNIIGILPGARRPDEYVLYTAHWDHLGRCKPADDGDDICNGAVDNATGTAALVALAEAFGKAGAPDRSVVFLAVTGEESGLLGSSYYGENPVYPLSQTAGGINMDAFLMAGKARNVTVIGKGKSQLDDFLAVALKKEGRVAEADPMPQNGYYYRSDHFSLAKQGVPMLYIDGGDDLVNGGKAAGEAAGKDFTVNRYHGPKDEYNPNWDWSGVIDDLSLYYSIGRSLAMSKDWPNWVEGDEFRAIRDKSRAGQ